MKILAIDTSTHACSCSLYLNGEIFERYQLAPQQHNQLILPMLDSLLAETGITLTQCDAIAFAQGPGSFTGLRIATAVAQGLAIAADLPVIAISTLLAMAQGAYRVFQALTVIPLLEGSRELGYWGCYQINSDLIMQSLIPERCSELKQLKIPDAVNGVPLIGVGHGWSLISDDFKDKIKPNLVEIKENFYCHARDVAQLACLDYQNGRLLSAAQALPMYLFQPQYVQKQ